MGLLMTKIPVTNIFRYILESSTTLTLEVVAESFSLSCLSLQGH